MAPTSDKAGRRLQAGCPGYTHGLALATTNFTSQSQGASEQGTRNSSESILVARYVILQL